MKTMHIKGQLTADDYIRALRLHMSPGPILKWVLVVLFGVSIFLLSLMFCPHICRRGVPDVAYLLILVLLCFPLLIFVFVPFRARRVFKQQKNLQAPQDITITEEGITASSAFGSGQMKWSDYHKHKVGKDFVLLYHSDAVFSMFPRRWFESDEHFEEFLAHVTKGMEEKR